MTTLKTARLTLRPLTLEDAPALQTQFYDYAIISELAYTHREIWHLTKQAWLSRSAMSLGWLPSLV